jgi:hypothetical protein
VAATRVLAPALLLLVVMAGGFSYSVLRSPSIRPRVVAVVAATEGQNTSVVAAAAPQAASEPGRSQRPPVVVVDGTWMLPSPWLVSWPLGFLIIVGAVVFLSRPTIVVRDSEEFTTALATWHPLFFTRHSTPRSAKRFLNRVRYYAMRQRDLPEERCIDRIASSLVRWRRHESMKPPVAATVDAIPEPILVALSAIEHAHPKWLEEDRLFKDPEGFLADQAVPQALAETLPARGGGASDRSRSRLR